MQEAGIESLTWGRDTALPVAKWSSGAVNRSILRHRRSYRTIPERSEEDSDSATPAPSDARPGGRRLRGERAARRRA